jgi:hypothetical protein
MRVAVFGSYDWSNYMDLVRSLTIFIQESHGVGLDHVIFIHSGKVGAENMITEYIGKTERFLRQKGFKIKESLFRSKTKLQDIDIIESGIDYAIVFTTGDKRTLSAKKLLEAYGIPFRIVQEA